MDNFKDSFFKDNHNFYTVLSTTVMFMLVNILLDLFDFTLTSQ